MPATIWYPGYTVTASFNRQDFTGTAGQTLFVLTNFTYTPGNNDLQVFINGQLQRVNNDYLETNQTTVTLLEGVVAGDLVSFVVVGA